MQVALLKIEKIVLKKKVSKGIFLYIEIHNDPAINNLPEL